MGHPGSTNVARARYGVTRAFTSPDVKRVVADRGIQLMTYADLK
jgi:hypothetical protein